MCFRGPQQPRDHATKRRRKGRIGDQPFRRKPFLSQPGLRQINAPCLGIFADITGNISKLHGKAKIARARNGFR